MRRALCFVALLAVAPLPVYVACSTSASQPSGTTGIPPGSPCGTSIAGNAQLNCMTNPQIPGCYLCVTFPNDASAPLCEYACHLNQSDCPGGRTCVLAGGYASTGCVASDLGYCQ